MNLPDVQITFAPLDAILPLRQRVIIAGTNRDSPYFPGDDAADTRHAGVFSEQNCIACATALVSHWEDAPAWQLRGMAVAPENQRQGLGHRLLAFLECELPRILPASGIWCNARETAVPFYLKAGFQVMSDRFHIEGVGPHFRLFKSMTRV